MTDTFRIVVVGGGRMGGGIAHSLLVAGAEVTVVEEGVDAAAQARTRIVAGLEAAEQRGFLNDDVTTLAERLEVCGVIEDIARDFDAAIEAVPEVPGLKMNVLGTLSRLVPPECTIASNTSSISIDELAMAVEDPRRFLGMHFFNPVPASRLVEIVRGASTGDAAIEHALGLVSRIGKTPILVADRPGFASTRLGVILGLEAIRMVEEGVASAAEIDQAMTLGYGHSLGPLRTTDLVGLDVRLAIAEYLAESLGERFSPPQLMRDMVATGRIGRKSGGGFFEWG